jgi:hypothetical protein
VAYLRSIHAGEDEVLLALEVPSAHRPRPSTQSQSSSRAAGQAPTNGLALTRSTPQTKSNVCLRIWAQARRPWTSRAGSTYDRPRSPSIKVNRPLRT